MSTLIRHAGAAETLTVSSLTVSVIGSALGRLLVPTVGRVALYSSLSGATGETAVAMSTVAGLINPEQGPAVFGMATALAKNG